MVNILKYIFLSFLFISCSSKEDPTDIPPINNIFPSNLTLSITIVGSDPDNPNGDGSGMIQCMASADEAISYGFRFGTGVELESISGNYDYTFTNPGVNSYTISVYAYSSTGDSVNISETITVYVEEPDPVATWSEEFNIDGSPSSDPWVFEIGTGCPDLCGWGNGESQYYTDRMENVKVEDGVLKITAKTESYNGSNYTSARIISRDKYEFQYGRVDIRAKLPTGSGTWPALWLLGANQQSVGWPACGEIDIMEHWGHNPTIISAAIHTSESFGDTQNHGQTTVTDYSTQFHIYSINWTAEKIEFLVDDNIYYTYNPSPKTDANWPFDAPAFFILNIAMGGHWFDIDPNFEQSTMEVDYIRVYQ